MPPKREMVRTVAERLPSSATISVYPDHPYLLQGPDILVGYRGTLTAIFVLAGREQLAKGRLTLAHLLLCRLALPSHTVFVGVAEDPDYALDRDPSVLSEVVGFHQRDLSLLDLVSDSIWSFTADALRPDHLDRFADNWQLRSDDEIQRASRRRPGRSTLAINVEETRRPRSRYLEVEQDHLVLGRLDDRSGQLQRTAVSGAVVDAIELDYGLDAGENGLERTATSLRDGEAHLATHLSFVAPPPYRRSFDPLKEQRAAAFAGFRPEFRSQWEFTDAV